MQPSQDLPFFGNPFGEAPDLPEELLNEPFSYEDNGLRPEIVKKRDKFLFKIDDKRKTSSVRVGALEYSGERNINRPHPPSKDSSNISVVTVYDTYGLGVVYSYLKHLYSLNQKVWVATYLIGSLEVVQPGAISNTELHRSSSLCIASLLFLKLAYLDSIEPKISEPFTTLKTYLPPEILSLLIPSDRVAKSVSSNRQESRCDKIPTRQELARVNVPSEASPIYLLPTGQYFKTNGSGDSYREYIVTPLPDGSWKNEVTVNPEIKTDISGAKIVGYRINDYESVFSARGCSDTVGAVVDILQGVKNKMRRATEADIKELIDWHARLWWDDTESGEEFVLENFRALRSYVLDVIDATIENWSAHI